MNVNNYKRGFAAMLAVLLLLTMLTACSDNPVIPETTGEPTVETTVATEPPPTAPADGNPDDVTCKGSYSDEAADPEGIAAVMSLIMVSPEDPVEESTEETIEETTEVTEEATEATEETAEATEGTTEVTEETTEVTEGTTEATEETTEATEETTEATEETAAEAEETTDSTEEATEPTEPPVTEVTLTNEELQVWYWMEVAAHRVSGQEGPDYEQGLDTQLCDLDETAVTWQQYFLQKALNSWHTSQALVQMAQDLGLPTEEAYQPNLENHGIYLVDIPATKYLYGYNKSYTPNEMHQAYLDSIPQLLDTLAEEQGFASAAQLAQAAACADEAALQEYARVYNLAYMYFTNLHYYIEPTAEEVEAKAAQMENITGKTVDLRHILLVPEGTDEEAWAACEKAAATMLTQFLGKRDHSEPRFAELAHDNSMDAGSASNGGAYRNIGPGQLVEALDAWCFDDARQPGDTELIRTDCGWHIVYFCGSTENRYAAAEEALIAEADRALMEAARESYLMTVDYSAIVLQDADSSLISAGDLLYPDVAHERYPTVPLYLQQDYPNTRYGAYPITTHGCGITTMAMLSSYMTDSELTPPELCARFGQYCLVNGTDSKLFEAEPAALGFFLLEKTYQWQEAKAAMAEGYTVVCVQHKGYWTRGGHFLVLQEMKENEMLIVRDSNIYNYGKLPGHKVDEFTWGTVVPNGMGYWIFDYKLTRIGACSRCGEETEGVAFGMFTNDYTCEKCEAALQRRNHFRELCS